MRIEAAAAAAADALVRNQWAGKTGERRRKGGGWETKAPRRKKIPSLAHSAPSFKIQSEEASQKERRWQSLKLKKILAFG